MAMSVRRNAQSFRNKAAPAAVAFGILRSGLPVAREVFCGQGAYVVGDCDGNASAFSCVFR